jgi:hypothetical protein
MARKHDKKTSRIRGFPPAVEHWLEARRVERELREAAEAALPKVIPDQIVPAKFRFNLGEYVRDAISGTKGYIVVRTEHISGCVQYWLTDKGHGASVTTDRIIDEAHLERTGTPPFVIADGEAPGCVLLKL